MTEYAAVARPRDPATCKTWVRRADGTIEILTDSQLAQLGASGVIILTGRPGAPGREGTETGNLGPTG